MERLQRAIGEFTESRPIPRIGASSTVAKAIEVMRELDTPCVFVEEDEKLVGVFTERDLLIRVVAERKSSDTAITEVMTPEPETLRAHDNIAYAINKMAVGGYRNIPITGTDHRLEGALSVHDVVSHLAEVFSADSDEGDAGKEWIDIGGGD